jgi:glycosyltransferase involved in cell wall biosynthesis
MPQPPLQIAHITWGLDVGGLEKLLVEFARHSDRTRVRLHFVSLGTRGELAEEIERCGWPVLALQEPTGLRPGLIGRLAALFRRWRIDVVHTHDPRALVYGGLAARLARTGQLLHTWHGLGVQGSPREKLLFRWVGQLTDQIITVSEDASRLLVEHGIAAHKLRVLRNGIDTSKFAYTGPAPGGPAVTVARLSPEKDLATLVRAAAIIKETAPGFRLEIAGTGVCLGELQALITELQLHDQVQLLGQRQDVPEILRRASLFVLPSLTEGISLAVLEAQARGLPVVATAVGGNPEIVAAGVSGLLVPPASPPQLADAILRVYRDGALAQKMGQAGRQRVEELFDVRRMVRDYETLYQQGKRFGNARARKMPGREVPGEEMAGASVFPHAQALPALVSR